MLSNLKSHLTPVQWDAIFWHLLGKADPNPSKRGLETQVGPKTLVLKGRISLWSRIAPVVLEKPWLQRMQLLLPSQASLGDSERWEHISEDLATISEIYWGRALKTVRSSTKKAGTSWWSEEPPVWRKSSKDTIGPHMTKCTMQPGKSLPPQTQLSLSVSEHETHPKRTGRCRVQPASLDLIHWTRNCIFTLSPRD